MHALTILPAAGPEVHGLFFDQCSLQNTAYPKMILEAATLHAQCPPTVAKKQEKISVDISSSAQAHSL